MKISLILSGLASCLAMADLKSLGSAMHGEKMAVSYEVLNTGRHVLVVKEKTGVENKKAKFKRLQVVEIILKEGDSLSPYNGFKCRDKKNSLAYAVVSNGSSKKEKSFSPTKAWIVDEKNLRLVPSKDESITCSWDPEGESN